MLNPGLQKMVTFRSIYIYVTANIVVSTSMMMMIMEKQLQHAGQTVNVTKEQCLWDTRDDFLYGFCTLQCHEDD